MDLTISDIEVTNSDSLGVAGRIDRLTTYATGWWPERRTTPSSSSKGLGPWDAITMFSDWAMPRD
jgi:hypothetical protein